MKDYESNAHSLSPKHTLSPSNSSLLSISLLPPLSHILCPFPSLTRSLPNSRSHLHTPSPTLSPPHSHPHSSTPTLSLSLTTTRYGQGTRDMAGPSGLTTEAFISKVAWRLGRYVAAEVDEVAPRDLLMPSLKFRRNCTYIFYSILFFDSIFIVPSVSEIYLILSLTSYFLSLYLFF